MHRIPPSSMPRRAAALLAALLLPTAAFAQGSYPTKPVQIIVSWRPAAASTPWHGALPAP